MVNLTIALCTLILVAMVGLMLGIFSPAATPAFIGTAFVAGGLVALFRFFMRAQTRSVEWLAISFLCATALSAVCNTFEHYAVPLKDGIAPRTDCCIAVVLFVLCSSAVGWHTISRFKEQRPRRRLWILAAHWLCAAGMSYFVVAIELANAMPISERPSIESALLIVLLLAVPALSVHAKLRAFERTQARLPTRSAVQPRPQTKEPAEVPANSDRQDRGK